MGDVPAKLDGRENNSRYRSIFYSLGFLLTCSVILNVLLAKKINRLVNRPTSVQGDARPLTNTVLPALQAKTVEGASVRFEYGPSELPTIIYVLSPNCDWCEKNKPNLEVLAESIANRYRFVAVSTISNGLKEYLESARLRFQVYTDIPDTIFSAYQMGVTPLTIIVSPEGIVLEAWQGAYVEPLKSHVESYLGIHLPGVQP